MKKNNFIGLILFNSILCIIITWFITGKTITEKDVYQSNLSGAVKETRFVGRGNGYVQIKFKANDIFNRLCVIKINQEDDILENDSINKPMYSNKFDIYRIDKSGLYKKIKTLEN